MFFQRPQPPVRRQKECLRLIALVLVAVAVWCLANHRFTPGQWKVPLTYQSDALFALARFKSASEGHYWPALPKNNPYLGAPFIANNNDFPTTEDTLYFGAGVLAKIIGLFPASNFLVLFAQVLAAVSFYAVCLWLRYGWEWAFMGALVFAFSFFSCWRSLTHFMLTYYWHVPLCLLVCWWLGSRRGVSFKDRRYWFAMAVAFVTGLQNPYYTNLFLQFLGFAFLVQCVRRSQWRKLAAPVSVGAVAIGAFLITNAGSFYYWHFHGKNPAAVQRSYSYLEAGSLKPIELFVPPLVHRLGFMRAIGGKYIQIATIQSEVFSGYLGLIGIAALLWLSAVTFARLSRRPLRPVPVQSQQIIWILLYSMLGGGGCVLALCGLQLFRANSRYSIWILALVLLFLVRQLTRSCRQWPRWLRTGCATAACAVALLDQIPRHHLLGGIYALGDGITKNLVDSDRQYAGALEKALPPGSMVFELPVVDYPESAPIVGMYDYEHLRPYLYSHTLRYSYGSDKGRGGDAWQRVVERMEPARMISTLESYGFGAIHVNRNGYADNGKSLIAGLHSAGREQTIESTLGDFACVILHPAAKPLPPLAGPAFNFNWYGEESGGGSTWHWSSGDAETDFENPSPTPMEIQISFEATALKPRGLTLLFENAIMLQTKVTPQSQTIGRLTLVLKPGKNRLFFKTDLPPSPPEGSDDRRNLALMIRNFTVERTPSQ